MISAENACARATEQATERHFERNEAWLQATPPSAAIRRITRCAIALDETHMTFYTPVHMLG